MHEVLGSIVLGGGMGVEVGRLGGSVYPFAMQAGGA